jgi:hypothetical protein
MVADGGLFLGVLFAFPVAFAALLSSLLVVTGWLRARGVGAVSAGMVGAVVAPPLTAVVAIPFAVPVTEVATAAFWIAACFPLGVALSRRTRVLASLALLVLVTVALRWTFQSTFVDVLLFVGVGGALLFVAGYLASGEAPESSE